MTELRDRWARNNDPERLAAYVRPVLTIALGIFLLAAFTSPVIGIVVIAFGALESALLLARLWLRRHP